MGRLDGKVALVTGAARGTGEVTARLLAREGARVAVTDILDDRGRAVAEDVGDAACYLRLDVTREEDWANAVDATTERFGPLSVLVNNAAVLEVESIANTTLERLTQVVHVNQIGPFLGVRAAIEPMKACGGGSIVNVASVDAMEGVNGVVAYTSSKWGLRGLTKAAAIELGAHNIRVNTVCPLPGSGEMVAPFMQRAIDRLKGRTEPLPNRPQHPFARRGELIDVARAVLFLASDESSYVSGVDLPVDGAFTAGKIEPGSPFS